MYASSFRGTAQQRVYSDSPDLSPSECFPRENLQPLMCLGLIEKEEIIHQRVFYACQTIQNHPGAFEMLRQPVVDVYLRALMQVEDILRINCETRLDKQ